VRNKDILLEIEDVSVFYQYLYLSPEHHIMVSNGITELKFELNDSLKIMQTNMKYPQFGASNQPLDLTNILGIIDKLKNTPPNQYPETFENRWQEIKETTMGNLALNLLCERW
jgi:hypothetical protein